MVDATIKISNLTHPSDFQIYNMVGCSGLVGRNGLVGFLQAVPRVPEDKVVFVETLR
jgi:hypothetical protein